VYDILVAFFYGIVEFRGVLLDVSHEVYEVHAFLLLEAERGYVVLHHDLDVEAVNSDIEELEVELLDFLGSEIRRGVGELSGHSAHLEFALAEQLHFIRFGCKISAHNLDMNRRVHFVVL
jgi:hypothetical protein